MKFKNTGEKGKFRFGDLNNYYWLNVKHGQIIDISEKDGILHGFEKVKRDPEEQKPKEVQGKLNEKVVETKLINYEKELKSIKGIGKKTAKDLLVAFPTRNSLIHAIQSGEEIPIRDDIELKLREYYGRFSN